MGFLGMTGMSGMSGMSGISREVIYDPTFTYDSFTDANGTALASHVGELGATWTLDGTYNGTGVITDANRLRPDSGSNAQYATSGTPPTADYEVSFDMPVIAAVATVCGPIARGAVSPAYGYIFLFNGQSGQWLLFNMVAGTPTQLASALTGALTVGQTYKLKLTVVGTSVKCYVDGIETLTATDSAVTAKGTAGIWLNGALSNSTGAHVDNFRAAAVDRQVAFDGNSLTAGNGSSGGHTYPVDCFRDLIGFRYAGNFGVSGQTSADMESDAATQIDTLYSGSLRSNVLVAWEIRNSIVIGGRTQSEAYNDFVTYCQNRRAAGWKVVVLTALPSQFGDEPGSWETDRLAINTLIRANYSSFADRLVDVASDSRLSNVNDTTYFDADKCHLNNTGYEVVAGLVGAVVAGM